MSPSAVTLARDAHDAAPGTKNDVPEDERVAVGAFGEDFAPNDRGDASGVKLDCRCPFHPHIVVWVAGDVYRLDRAVV